MIKEKNEKIIVCDCCDAALYDTGIRRNDGSFQEPYVKFDNIDLCFNCAGKIFYRNGMKKLSKDELESMIISLKQAESPSPLNPLQNLELDII